MSARTHVTQLRVAAMLGLALLVTACASAPEAPEGAAAARAELTRLQSDPQLATRAPQALQEAEAAVVAAEQPENDEAKASHRVFMAERKVALARALATARLAEDERAQLAQQRDEARLRARTEEAVAARDQAVMAQAAAAGAQQHSAELQREIDALRAKTTDQGLVLTLGDVLFETGRADLKPGAVVDLDRLVTFLAKYPERTVIIEGHTDNVPIGNALYPSNWELSSVRASSVVRLFIDNGVAPLRLTAIGHGANRPVDGNDTPEGRLRNRRVQLMIMSNLPDVLKDVPIELGR